MAGVEGTAMELTVNGITKIGVENQTGQEMHVEGRPLNKDQQAAKGVETSNNNIASMGVGRSGVSAKTGGGDKKAIGKSDIEAAVKEIQSQLDLMNTKLIFKIDPKYGEPVVQVIKKDNGEVLRQFPPEQLLEIRAAFKDLAKGVFLNEKA
ncbi:MAG: flagellar protein FlaG [Dissulfurimicrobium sp.]|uniref:flagellar protein FlaG n=1 Tax=Dissulfurimicrobium TaxID=1769732 RepID=UPI001EDB52D3|nr:flagellar protein FlaG [Dissulfurimicrobium hydrothermale]UKL12879.1 flagellar protein FlaG [Dissulfurimicrobium hydrothermale]